MALDTAQVGLAFIAGVIGFLSPCALPMLPSYVVYYLKIEEGSSGRGLLVSMSFVSATTLGFMTVFASLGLLPSLALQMLRLSASVLTPVIGLVMIAIGLLYALSSVFDRVPRIGIAPRKASGYLSFYIYGVAYALTSLGCSLPVFLLVVLQSATQGAFVDGLLLFILYTLGAGSVMVPLTLTISLSKKFVDERIAKALPYMRMVGAAVIVVSGAYTILSTIK